MKAFFLLIACVISLWSMSFEEAISNAKKENKKILVELVMEGCPYCERMEKYVLSKADVKEILDASFVFVVLDIDKDTIPDHLTSRMSPSFYFLSKDGQKILHEIKGAPPKSDFINQLKYVAQMERAE